MLSVVHLYQSIAYANGWMVGLCDIVYIRYMGRFVYIYTYGKCTKVYPPTHSCYS